VTAGQCVKYYKDPSKAAADLSSGAIQVAFFMNAVTIQEFRDVSLSGHVLPQKSTFFYPKIGTGLLIFPVAADDRVPGSDHPPAGAGYRFSIDSVILAGFAAPYCRGAVLDLGTGCGVLLLLLSRLAPGMLAGIGVDLQEDLLDFARRNFGDNCPDGRLHALHGDFRGEIPGVEPGSFDLVVSNPPYGRVGQGRRNPDPGKERARHEATCTLPELFAAASRFLSAAGRFAFILPYPRLTEIEPCAAKEGLRVEYLRVVHPRTARRRSGGSAVRFAAEAELPAFCLPCSCMGGRRNIVRKWSGSADSFARCRASLSPGTAVKGAQAFARLRIGHGGQSFRIGTGGDRGLFARRDFRLSDRSQGSHGEPDVAHRDPFSHRLPDPPDHRALAHPEFLRHAWFRTTTVRTPFRSDRG